MEIQVNELIEKIKNEAILNSEQAAKLITDNAAVEAKRIVEQARAEADGIIARAKDESSRHEANSKQAIRQAARDFILKVQAEIKAIFEKIVHDDVEHALKNEKVLMASIVKIVEHYIQKQATDLSLLLDPEDLKMLETAFSDKLKIIIKKGIEIHPFPGLKSGFNVEEKGSGLTYDFTDKGIAECLSQYLSARLGELVKSSIDGKEQSR
jgi:V/A-type H+/Na+-transporting ATPase subunit E